MQPHALLQLSGLTSLTTLVSDANLGVLAQLTGLQALSCEVLPLLHPEPTTITQAGLLQLTALNQFTCLRFAEQCKQYQDLLGPTLQEQQLDGRYRTFVSKVRPPV